MLSAGTPFVFLDDARPGGHRLLYHNPREVIVAETRAAVAPALARLRQAVAAGSHAAGYLAYEAGLALEQRLAPGAAARTGAGGPLVWFGLFDEATTIPAAEVAGWLAERGGSAPASIGPLVPQLSIGQYLAAFDRLQQAIRDGDIYQANLTMPLAGGANGAMNGLAQQQQQPTIPQPQPTPSTIPIPVPPRPP